MNDQELMEMAAKAAEIVVIRSRLNDPLLVDFLVEKSARNINQHAGAWNPLIDNGDALRLAVKLRMDVTFNEMYVSAFPSNFMDGCSELVNVDDPYAATRQAITRAAAAIGRAMV